MILEPQLLAPQKDPGTSPRLSPIRLSYHQEGHYNAVVDPYEPNIGVGLGLPNYQPGVRYGHGCFEEAQNFTFMLCMIFSDARVYRFFEFISFCLYGRMVNPTNRCVE